MQERADFIREFQIEEKLLAKLNRKKTTKDALQGLQQEVKDQYRVREEDGKLTISTKPPRRMTIKDLR